jgi:regulatory protein
MMITLVAKKASRGKVSFEFSNQLTITLAKSDPRCYDYQSGVEYSQTAIESLKHELETLAAERKLSDSLARGPKSIGQARRALAQKGFSSGVVDEIITRFIRAGFLDDRVFARQTVNYLIENNPAGRAYLRSVLLKKLLSSELAEEVVNECFADVDESELAERILRKSWWRLRELPLETARQKAYTQLARKSIGYDPCRTAFDKLTAEESECASAVFEQKSRRVKNKATP